jgi:hypothetical protein
MIAHDPLKKYDLRLSKVADSLDCLKGHITLALSYCDPV